MYKEYFGLRANPFNVNPDPRYLYLTRHTEEALACLTYGIQSRKGFVLLTGEVGTGKTTLINKLMEWLRLQQVATPRELYLDPEPSRRALGYEPDDLDEALRVTVAAVP